MLESKSKSLTKGKVGKKKLVGIRSRLEEERRRDHYDDDDLFALSDREPDLGVVRGAGGAAKATPSVLVRPSNGTLALPRRIKIIHLDESDHSNGNEGNHGVIDLISSDDDGDERALGLSATIAPPSAQRRTGANGNADFAKGPNLGSLRLHAGAGVAATSQDRRTPAANDCRFEVAAVPKSNANSAGVCSWWESESTVEPVEDSVSASSDDASGDGDRGSTKVGGDEETDGGGGDTGFLPAPPQPLGGGLPRQRGRWRGGSS